MSLGLVSGAIALCSLSGGGSYEICVSQLVNRVQIPNEQREMSTLTFITHIHH